MSEHGIVVDTALYGVKTRKKRVRNERGVGAVEDSNLSCAIHFEIIGNDNVKSALVEGDLLAEISISLDYPKVEVFRGVDHLVVKANVDLLVLGIACIDSVNEGVAEDVFIFYPRLKALAEFPKVGILKHALFKVCAVFIDELAGKEYESGKTELVSLCEKLSKLCREAFCRSVGDLIVILKADSCLGGVGNNKTEIGVFGKRHIRVEIVVGLNAAGDNVDLFDVNALASAAEMSVNATLRLQHVTHTLLNGLNNNYLAAEVGVFVDYLKHPIGKSAKKTALAKLYNSFFHSFFPP